MITTKQMAKLKLLVKSTVGLYQIMMLKMVLTLPMNIRILEFHLLEPMTSQVQQILARFFLTQVLIQTLNQAMILLQVINISLQL